MSYDDSIRVWNNIRNLWETLNNHREVANDKIQYLIKQNNNLQDRVEELERKLKD